MSPESRRFWRVLGVVLLAAFALRAGYVITVTHHDEHFYDAAFYEQAAHRIVDGDGFVDPLAKFNHQKATPTAEHPPLTFLLLVPAAALAGDSDLWLRMTMALLGVGVVALVGLLGRRLGGDAVGLIAAGVAAVYPNLWMNDGLLMSETVASLTTVAAILVAVVFLRRPTVALAVALGVLCGLAALTRAELSLLVLFLALPAVWVAGSGRRVQLGLATLAAAGLVVAPWVVYNFTRFEEPTFLTTSDGHGLLGATCNTTYYGREIGLWTTGCLPIGDSRIDESVNSRELRERAIDYIDAHKTRLPVVMVARVGRLLGVYDPQEIARFTSLEGRPRWATYLGMVSFLILAVLAVVGCVAMRRRRARFWALLAPIWIVLVFAVLYYGTPRFRSPAEPSIVVLGVIGALVMLARRRPSLAPVFATPRGDAASAADPDQSSVIAASSSS